MKFEKKRDTNGQKVYNDIVGSTNTNAGYSENCKENHGFF